MKKGFVILGKLVAGVTLLSSVAIFMKKYMSRKSEELERNNEGQKEKKYQICMDGKQVKICQEEVEDISINCCMGGFVLDLTESYIAKDVNIKVQSIMSGGKIIVPPMIRVVVTGEFSVMSGIANLVPMYEKEEIPTIYISVKNIMGGFSVQMQP